MPAVPAPRALVGPVAVPRSHALARPGPVDAVRAGGRGADDGRGLVASRVSLPAAAYLPGRHQAARHRHLGDAAGTAARAPTALPPGRRVHPRRSVPRTGKPRRPVPRGRTVPVRPPAPARPLPRLHMPVPFRQPGGMEATRKQVLDAVGPRLRELRRRRGMTLAELAERTGINESTLSRLEGGGRKPTLELLLTLAEVHAVPIDELVGAPRTGDPRIHLRPVTRDGLTYVPLAAGRDPGAQAADPATPGRASSCGPTRASNGSTSWPAACCCCSASGVWSLSRARPPSSTPMSRTGSVPKASIRSNCSSCSGGRANGHLGPHRLRRARPGSRPRQRIHTVRPFRAVAAPAASGPAGDVFRSGEPARPLVGARPGSRPRQRIHTVRPFRAVEAPAVRGGDGVPAGGPARSLAGARPGSRPRGSGSTPCARVPSTRRVTSASIRPPNTSSTPARRCRAAARASAVSRSMTMAAAAVVPAAAAPGRPPSGR